MKTKKLIHLGLATFVAVAPVSPLMTPSLNATAIVGATEPTQIMNNIELGGIGLSEIDQLTTQISQLATMIQQYETMLLNMVKMPFAAWGNVIDCINKVKDLAATAQGFAYTLGNLDEEFKAAHPDFESYINGRSSTKPADFAAQYQKWGQSVNEAAKAAIKTAGYNLDGIKSDADFMEVLQKQSDNASGQLDAIQAGNQFAGFLNQQMIQLRSLAATQNNAINAYNAAQEAKAAAQAAAEAKAFKLESKAFKGTKRY